MNNKEIIVTGSTGHIGNRLVKALIERGYKVIALVRKESTVSNYLKSLGAEIVVCDLHNTVTFSKYLKKKYALFHLASENSTETKDKEKLIRNTLGITKSVIGAALKENVKMIVYTSSVVVLGRSETKDKLIDLKNFETNTCLPYVSGKIFAEKWIRGKVNTNTDIRIVYPSWVVGSGDYKGTPPNQFLSQLSTKRNFFSINGGVSLVHVDDVVEGHILAMEKGTQNSKYILSGFNLTFNELLNKISQIFNRPKPFFNLPSRPLKKVISILGNFSPIDPKYGREVIGKYSWYDNQDSIKELGYKCRKIDAIFDDIKLFIKQKDLNINHLNLLERKKYKSKDSSPTLLITGYPGWLGNRVLQKLNQDINQNKKNRFKNIKLLVQERYIEYLPNLSENFEIVNGDLSNFKSLISATKGVDIVWHLAGTVYPKKKKAHYDVNYLGTKNLADACIKNKVKKFLFMSTDSVCGYERKKKFFSLDQSYNPYKDYGKSKYLAEKLLKSYDLKNLLNVTILRGFWFFGPNMPSRNKKFFKSFFWKYQVLFGSGQNYRSITHLDDVFYSLIELGETKKINAGVYWITSLDKNMTVFQIYKLIAKSFNTKLRILFVPNIICEIISILDKIYTSITGNINPTLLAAGKFHKNIAITKNNIDQKHKHLIWKSRISIQELQEEIRNEFIN